MSKPLIQVLDSSILAEYGNCDRLLEVLEQSEEIAQTYGIVFKLLLDRDSSGA